MQRDLTPPPAPLFLRLAGRMRGWLVDPCCDLWDVRYGCPHEICPGCFCVKGHEQNVCDDCHDYNMAYPANPDYVAKYGASNTRLSAVSLLAGGRR